VFRLLFCLRAVPRLVDIVEDKMIVFGHSATLYFVIHEVYVGTQMI